MTNDEINALAGPVSVGGWQPGRTLRRAFQALVRTLRLLGVCLFGW